MIFLNNFIFLLSEIFLSSLLLFLIILGVFLNKLQLNYKYYNSLNNILILSLIGFVYLFFLVYFQFNCDFYILNFHYFGDRLNSFFKILLVLFMFLILILSIDFIKFEKEFYFEYYILMFLALLGLLLIISANDFIFLYLSLELQSLSLYVLATSNRYLNKSIEGGLKYFILGSLASGFFLFGISLLYGLTGLTALSELEIFLQNPSGNFFIFGFLEDFNSIILLILSIFFILSSFIFKFSIAPFHSWTPDVYEGSPLLMVAFFALLPKIAILFIFIKFFFIFFESIFFTIIWQHIFYLFGLLSIFIGSLGALTQIKIKRLLAYSTISNMGFIFLSLSTFSFNGIQAIIVYLIIYIFLNLIIFGVLLSSRKINGQLIINITELTSLYQVNPIYAIILTLTLFSIAGIPPLSGFFSKYFIIVSLIEVNSFLLAFFTVFIGVYSSIYYIRLIKILFFEKPSIWLFYKKISYRITYFLITFTFFNITFLYWIGFFLNFLESLDFYLFF